MQAAETGTLKDEVPLNVFSCLNKAMHWLNTAAEGGGSPWQGSLPAARSGHMFALGSEKCPQCVDTIKLCSLGALPCQPGGRAAHPMAGPRVTLTQDVGISLQIAGAWKKWINSQANLERN